MNRFFCLFILAWDSLPCLITFQGEASGSSLIILSRVFIASYMELALPAENFCLSVCLFLTPKRLQISWRQGSSHLYFVFCIEAGRETGLPQWPVHVLSFTPLSPIDKAPIFRWWIWCSGFLSSMQGLWFAKATRVKGKNLRIWL